jgi:peptidoglycan hydrolase-like protein with peptidoglycan-binding domain
VRALQQRLAELGYPAGAVDGVYGERTKAAVILYQQREGLAGEPGKWIIATSMAAAKPLDNPRSQTTLTGLKNTGDAQTQQLSLGKRVTALLGAASGAGGAIAQTDPSQLPQALSDARGIIEPIHEHMQWAAQHWYLAAGMGAALLCVLFHNAAQTRVADVSQGKATP